MALQSLTEEFVTHGIYCVTNSVSFEIQLSDTGEALRAKKTLFDGTYQLSEWIEITPDIFDTQVAKDVFGFDIRLDQVMRLPKYRS